MASRATFDLGKMARSVPKIMATMINDVGAVFVGDMFRGAKRGVDVTNAPFTALEENTIKAKRRKGSKTPSKPLFDTGKMAGGYFLSKKATASDLEATVTTAGIGADGVNRRVMGVFHNEGGKRPNRPPQRKHFIVPGRPGDLKRTSKRIGLVIRRGGVKIVRSAKK